jgi:hypothetical protein
MSQLRSQLRKIMPRLAQDANKLRDREARSRWMKLKQITESTKSLARACAFYGWSEDAYNKWGTRLRKQPRMASIMSKSRKPHRSPNKTKPRKEKKVAQFRRADPSLGPERISFDLERFFNMLVPPSTVYAILRRAKMVSVKLAERLTKKHLKRYRRPWPGYLQMDFKYVPYLINGKQLYQLSCVDHHSSWRLIRIYTHKNTKSVLEFLEILKRECPFPIEEIQTDNDTAFTDKFWSGKGVTGEHLMDIWCFEKTIVHRLIPVGVKELNGKVENTHKQDDREFFAKGPYRDLRHIQVCSRGYNQRWNERRATKALKWQTPEETVASAYVRALAYHQALNVKSLDDLKPTLGGWPVAQKTKNRTRKQNQVEKYLNFLEWEDAKKKLPIFFTYPTMSQNFSPLIPFFVGQLFWL